MADDGDGDETFYLVVPIRVPAVPAGAGDVLIDLLRREALPAVVDRSAAGDPDDVIQAWALFEDDGARVVSRSRPSRVTVERSTDLAIALEQAGLTCVAIGGEPGISTDAEAFDGLMRTVDAPFAARHDALTAVRVDELTLESLARQERQSLRVGTLTHRAPDLRLIRRTSPAAANGALPTAAFLEGAVTFVRFANRRGFILAASPEPIVGIWDRDFVVLDPTSQAAVSGEVGTVGQVLNSLVADPHRWDRAVSSLVDDEETARSLRALLRETSSRADSFARLARLFGVPEEAASLAETGGDPPDTRDVRPVRLGELLRRQWRRTPGPAWSPAEPTWATAWLRFSGRHPVLWRTYTAVAVTVGLAGVLLYASTGQEWYRYIIPCLLLTVAVVDAVLPRPDTADTREPNREDGIDEERDGPARDG